MESRNFDCVEMKRKAQEAILRETAGMTLEEELAYWRRRGEELGAEQEASRPRPRVAG